jgi:hypothetical protein
MRAAVAKATLTRPVHMRFPQQRIRLRARPKFEWSEVLNADDQLCAFQAGRLFALQNDLLLLWTGLRRIASPAAVLSVDVYLNSYLKLLDCIALMASTL